jgi:hypothetical protein
VPTVDTVRNKYVVSSLVRVFTHTLVVGNVGVGKTMAVQSLLESIPADRYAYFLLPHSLTVPCASSLSCRQTDCVPACMACSTGSCDVHCLKLTD